MRSLQGMVAWVTGAGSGIGEAAARALAEDGCTVVLSGRRREPLERVCAHIAEAGGRAEVEPLDIADADAVFRAAKAIHERHGRIDILVNNAGLNAPKRRWTELTPASWSNVVQVDLNGPAYCAQAVLPFMRAQGDGLMIQISSWAGKFTSYVAGGVYSAAKHAMVAMSQSINMEEFQNGIRSTVIMPAEVATPILDDRPVKLPQHVRNRMLQPADLGETIRFVARMPKHACLNEILISPTWNRAWTAAPDQHPPVEG